MEITAMQKLIQEMKYLESYPMTSFVIRLATDLLEKEKEQICNAYTDGLEGPYIGAEQYYNQTFNQNK